MEINQNDSAHGSASVEMYIENFKHRSLAAHRVIIFYNLHVRGTDDIIVSDILPKIQQEI